MVTCVFTAAVLAARLGAAFRRAGSRSWEAPELVLGSSCGCR